MKIEQSIHCHWAGKSLLIKNLIANDIDERFIQCLKDSETTRYISVDPETISLNDQRSYINVINTSESNLILGFWVNQKLIGTVGVQNLSTLNKPCRFGLMIASNKYRGIGLGKYLIWAVTHLLLNTLSQSIVFVGIDPDNTPSIKSFERIGFKRLEPPNYPTILSEYVGDEYYHYFCDVYTLLKPSTFENIEIQINKHPVGI